ncbi:hypothetical protein BRC82_01895 [Halobacteriales archaeon QS_1_67_19]|nr:MAG: hypothetical protein BRC82_01895 [Halobacteriales archaeon QS_1_67_19]
MRRARSKRTTEAPTNLPDDTIYRLLENRRRRYLLYCLLEHEGAVSLSRAVDVVTAWENGCSVDEIRTTDRRSVYSSLKRTHLPRLETQNVAAYDEQTKTISWGPDAEKVTRWLDDDEKEIHWSQCYLGLAAIGAIVVAADLVADLLGLIPGNAGHAIVATLFAALTVLVVYDQYR